MRGILSQKEKAPGAPGARLPKRESNYFVFTQALLAFDHSY
jgi:hypothetical protein